jgi:NTE family protein
VNRLALQDPDVLVLGAGGVLGEAWMAGVLSGLQAAGGPDMREVESIVGTSAGAWVAARLMAGELPAGPPPPMQADEQPEAPPQAARASARVLKEATKVGMAVARPLVPVALSAVEPAGRIVRSAVLGRAPRAEGDLDALRRGIAKLGTRFDGRLRVVAVDRARGRRVVFGAPGAPGASVPEAVAASCAVPWLYAPIEIDGREYVDGGVWSPTNLDVAPARRETQVLCLTPTGHLGDERLTAFGIMRALGASATAVEAAALRQRGASVLVVAPDAQAGRAMGKDFMSAGPRETVLRAGWRQGKALAGGS